ncbi:MAG: hypothetical protein COT06_10855 [Syntrophobacteraceae bacterium CG07_land_8_20_14_0_80_61_8]|nr:MAG: hypothetical protein COT06_10855 [Syntrophobacteraceae bacterium CG07_land_8_20_14_0_80_61_8]
MQQENQALRQDSQRLLTVQPSASLGRRSRPPVRGQMVSRVATSGSYPTARQRFQSTARIIVSANLNKD